MVSEVLPHSCRKFGNLKRKSFPNAYAVTVSGLLKDLLFARLQDLLYF